MKLKNFIEGMTDILLHYPIERYTFDKLLELFKQCLSKKEAEKYLNSVKSFEYINYAQITIDKFKLKSIINELESKLEKMKELE